MLRLGVNIDHVATVRQARRSHEPDPVHAAVLAELGGADGITVHLRGDRRHIQDRDVAGPAPDRQTRLNIEMAATQEMIHLALTAKPDQVTLVPERREEMTTEGGLDVVLNSVAASGRWSKTLQDAGIDVSLFVDPDLEQVKEAHSSTRTPSSSTPPPTRRPATPARARRPSGRSATRRASAASWGSRCTPATA